MKFFLRETYELQIPATKGANPDQACTKTVYAYTSQDGSMRVAFYNHPTKSWHYLVDFAKTNEAGLKITNYVIDAWCAAALAARISNTTFEERIKVLEVNT